MQLLNFPPPLSPIAATQPLLEVLQDIVNNVEMQSDFSIRHPEYKTLELPVEVVERFQRMSDDMQQKYLSLQLRTFLYGIYYNGSMRTELAPDADDGGLPLDLENNTVLGVDMGFYQLLQECNSGVGYFDPGWLVIREEDNGDLAVTKGNLRLYIQPDKHLQTAEKSAAVGDWVAIRTPKNRVQNGFYVAIGNKGSSHLDNSKDPALVRIYFNLTPEGAVRIMGSLTQQLNEIGIPFHFKVLYNPKDYGRQDSGVLYFDKRDYGAIEEVVKAVYEEHQSHFQPEIPLFTLQLASGLGLAEEPDQKFADQESFGMNRCQIVANGLLESWRQGDNSPEKRMKSILNQFSLLGIDLQRTHLNADSEDIYRQL